MIINSYIDYTSQVDPSFLIKSIVMAESQTQTNIEDDSVKNECSIYAILTLLSDRVHFS